MLSVALVLCEEVCWLHLFDKYNLSIWVVVLQLLDQVTPVTESYDKVHTARLVITFKIWMMLFSLACRYFVFPLYIQGRVRGRFPEFLLVKNKTVGIMSWPWFGTGNKTRAGKFFRKVLKTRTLELQGML